MGVQDVSPAVIGWIKLVWADWLVGLDVTVLKSDKALGKYRKNNLPFSPSCTGPINWEPGSYSPC